MKCSINKVNRDLYGLFSNIDFCYNNIYFDLLYDDWFRRDRYVCASNRCVIAHSKRIYRRYDTFNTGFAYEYTRNEYVSVVVDALIAYYNVSLNTIAWKIEKHLLKDCQNKNFCLKWDKMKNRELAIEYSNMKVERGYTPDNTPVEMVVRDMTRCIEGIDEVKQKILCLLYEGYNNIDIAKMLCIERHKVGCYVSEIKAELAKVYCVRGV